MKKKILSIFSLILCFIILSSSFAVPTSAEKITYASGANGVSDAYKNSKYYKNLTSIELTGDGVTDTLAVALSQLEYVEGTSTSGFSGTQGGGGNYTEFCRNYGEGNSYAWCAAYVSFCLFQSRATTSTSKQTIWRDIYCPRWYQNMKNAGYGHDASSNYTPKSGDLVFFTGGGHIGIVRYVKNGKVYTIEGNTSNSDGLNPEGGGVYCKSYDRSYSKFLGFGTPPYKTNDDALKVDYSGENPTTGLWIGETAKNFYDNTNLSGDFIEIPKGTIFEVTKIVSKTCYQVNYNGKTGYIKGEGGSPIYQVTSNASKVQETESETVATNTYAISSSLKKVKEHVGSAISKYTLDDKSISKTNIFSINAGEKLGIEGYAGFTVAIKEFGYYFDGEKNNAVWGSTAKTANSSTKNKAGDKAKMFDIDADTSALSLGEHTVTYLVKFNNGNTCDLITLKLDVVSEGVYDSGMTSESYDDGDEEMGCGSVIIMGAVLPMSLIGGAILLKRKKED